MSFRFDLTDKFGTDMAEFIRFMTKSRLSAWVTHPKHEQLWLVGVTLEKRVDCFCSEDDDAREVMGKIIDPKTNPYKCWTVMTSHEEANKLAGEMRKYDLSCLVPDSEDQQKRDELFTKLNNDVSTLADFNGCSLQSKFKTPGTKVVNMISILKDYTVIKIKSDADSAMEYSTLLGENRAEVTGWILIEDEAEAEAFSKELASLNPTGTMPCPGLNALKNSPFCYAVKPPAATISVQKELSGDGVGGGSDSVGSTGMSSGASAVAVKAEVIDLEGGGMDLSGINAFESSGAISGGGNAMKIWISNLFPHKSAPIWYYTIVFQPPGAVYHWDGKSARLPIDYMVERVLKPQGKEVPYWMLNLRDTPLSQPRNPDSYKRGASGYVKTLLMTVGTYQKGHGSLALHANKIINTIASSYKPTSECGQTYALWLKQHKERVYTRETGETGSKKKITHEEFATKLQGTLVKMFENKTVNYNFVLDTYLTYGYIKEFFVNHCGYSSWSDVPVNLKKFVVTKNQAPYPDWDSTEIKSYTD